MKKIAVLGAGLAGLEAAYQISKRGIRVDLFDLKPERLTEGHKMRTFGEMICSNSLGSNEISTGAGLLKAELKILNSFFLKNAEPCRVAAGGSFSVDRDALSIRLTKEISKIDDVNIINKEVVSLPEDYEVIVVATGPLTTEKFSKSIMLLTGRNNLYFYDATSPIIDFDSIDFSEVFWGARYGKGNPDFINIPLEEKHYYEFISELVSAEKVELKNFEENLYFESCLPIEVIASRGKDSASFGPMKPVGFKNPKTGKQPYALVQLRQDDLKKNFFQMVGFQTRLKYSEQKRIFRTLPGLGKAEFIRYGRMHRNSYINAPLILDNYYRMKTSPNIFFAGQISGVEGYLESVCSGLIAGINAVKTLKGEKLNPLPVSTASGSLISYITESNWRDFRPSKFSFGLINNNKIKEKNKKRRKELKAGKALAKIEEWMGLEIS